MPTFLYATGAQTADTFGENLADAFESVFTRGYEHVIAIGNDCPTLTTQDLLLAAERLNSLSCVLAPASDGGVYLIGLRHSAYDRARFLQIDWQTSRVFAALKAYATGDFYCLDEKSDVDSAADLAKVLRAPGLPIRLKISLILCLKRLSRDNFYRVDKQVGRSFTTCCALRGPPCFAVSLRA